MFGNHIFYSPFVTQWVGDDLQNISAFYGGPSNELNWTFLNDRQSSSLWQGDDGTTQTLDAWENAYVVRTNPDGTLSAKPKYTSGLPEITLRKVDTMSADELGPGGEQQPEQTNVDTTEVKEENCDNHECPEGHGVMTKYNDDGSVSCDCVDTGEVLTTLGYGLGFLALTGLATTGIVIYGLYRIIRG